MSEEEFLDKLEDSITAAAKETVSNIADEVDERCEKQLAGLEAELDELVARINRISRRLHIEIEES